MTGSVDSIVMRHGRGAADHARPRFAHAPLLAALHRAGTQHVYGDTADVFELRRLLACGSEGTIRAEVDGNTANQPLVHEVAQRYLDAGDPRAWARELVAERPDLSHTDLLALVYAIVCARVGNDMAHSFAGGRDWQVSLQLHMDLCDRPDAARSVGRMLRAAVPTAFVKVPFTPDAPHCLLVARDLEREGIPVNLTSTFSARQVVAAALLCDVTRTNVFMGRLNQGLHAELLGEHVDLEAQRALRRLRERHALKTQLIVASMRDWQSFVRVAGCDVFTAPCGVLRDFLEQDEVPADRIESRLETSYVDELGIADAVVGRLGHARIERLYRVEAEFVEFLCELRAAPDYADLRSGEALYERFDRAGFADLFHTPSASEREEMQRGKLPQLDGTLVDRIPLDTHFSLLANTDFARHQREIDAEIERRITPGIAMDR